MYQRAAEIIMTKVINQAVPFGDEHRLQSRTLQRPYTCTIYDSIDDVDAGEWDAMLHPDGDAFMDRRFVRAVERSGFDGARFWSVIFRDDRRQPVGCACVYFYPLDLSLYLSGWLKKLAIAVNHFVPRLAHVKLVLCGLPVPTGGDHLRIAPGADVDALVDAMYRVLCTIARERSARRLGIGEFDDRACARLVRLEGLGFRRVESPGMNYTRAGFRDFDDYCSQVKSSKRRILKQSRNKFASSRFRVVHRNGHDAIDRLYTDDVHRLYEAVIAGKPVFARMPATFFRELARQMPDEAAYIFIEDGNDDRIVAFAASICAAQAYHQLLVGFDHDVNAECDLYFNLFFNAVDYAFRQNVAKIALGQTCDKFKMQKLSAHQVPLYYYQKTLPRFRSKKQLAVSPAICTCHKSIVARADTDDCR